MNNYCPQAVLLLSEGDQKTISGIGKFLVGNTTRNEMKVWRFPN